MQITYEQAGEGTPLVLIHGYVGDHRTWRSQIDALSDEFAVTAWDAPGFGGSSDPSDEFRLADYADCLAEFIRILDLGRPHVVGLSFGGTLALELYRRHPQIPASLVLASAYAGWAGSLPADVVEFRLNQALQLADLPPAALVDALLPTMFSAETSPDLVKEFAASIAEFHPAGLRATARAGAENDLRDVLPLISIPTLLVYGDQDVRAPLEVAEDLHARIQGSKLVVIPKTGHIVNIEAAEQFNNEVRAFIRDS